MHVTHPMLVPQRVEFRGYQANLARIATQHDTLVVLPTGMGKTVVALLVLADALQAGARRILVLAPTRPLVDQHARFLRETLVAPWPDHVHAVTGNDEPERRAALYQGPSIVVATPQVVHNDILSRRLDPAGLDWIVYDEAHRAVGDYPYLFIAKAARQGTPRALALTASPGHDARKVQAIRDALGLTHLEIRTAADRDVAPYVQAVDVEWETLPLPPQLARVSQRLQEALADRVKALKAMGHLKDAGTRPNRRHLLQLAGAIQETLRRTPEPDAALFTALSLQAQAMKLHHALELAQTQGATAFVEYLEGMRQEAASGQPSKATQSVLADERVNDAYHIARLDHAENPKLGRVGTLVQSMLEQDPAGRAIVFTHFRTTCEHVVSHLAKLPGVRPVLFVGQAKKGNQGGLSQKEQAKVVADFKGGLHNVLVATSVAEEGLDIPETDLVVFFEPIPSEIRAIQRRGRTGRQRAGRVVVLINKGTPDEAAHWVSQRREQSMVRELTALRTTLARTAPAVAAAGDATAPSVPPAGPAGSPAPGQQRLDQPAVPMPGGGPAVPSARAAPPASASRSAAAPTPMLQGAKGQRVAELGHVRILCDHREQAGGAARALHELGCEVEFRQLDVGDYVLSDRIVVERKSCRDFVDSLLDGRLFDQLRALQVYPRPVLVLEGDSLSGHRNVSPDAIYGALASVTIDYGIPVLQSHDPAETARLLVAIAKREQQRGDRKLAVRAAKPPMNDAERRRYLVCGLPGISDTLATRLLDHFGTVEAVMTADAATLAAVPGIGVAKAREVRRILESSDAAAAQPATTGGLAGTETV